MAIATSRSRGKKRPILTFSLRKVGCAIGALTLLYFQFLWSFLSKQKVNARNEKAQSGIPDDGTASKTNRLMNNVVEDANFISIGIASTVTGCGTEPFTEGAAVLKHSIEMTSIHGTKHGKYDYKFYIMYHPNATECVLPLRELGFVLLERPTPINVSDIQGDVLRERIVHNGCCGEKELIKLEAYRLMQHPVIIHLDLDVLVLKPMDDLIDFMLDPSSYSIGGNNVPIMWPERPIPESISLVFTKDYNVLAPRRKHKPFQGGFFALKPSEEIYREMIEIVRVGDYRDDKTKGWGGVVGPFHGGMTIQGLLPWYYEEVHPGMAVELNRCVYNNMADNPTTEKSLKNGTLQGRCRTNEEKCEDCRVRPLEEIVTFHYTVCQKPWHCLPQKLDVIEKRLCRQLHYQWYSYRSDLERSWGRNGSGTGSFEVDHFFGYCTGFGFKGYQQIALPYGKP